MRLATLRLRQNLQRHQQAICVGLLLLLILAVPGWLVNPILWTLFGLAVRPVYGELSQLTGDDIWAARRAYLKAFVRTERAQTTVIVVGMVCILALERAIAPSYFDGFPDLIDGFATKWLCLPPLIYLSTCLLSVGLRCVARATNFDPDLAKQKLVWSGTAYALFLLAFVGSIWSIVFIENSPFTWLAQWLVAAGRDATLTNMHSFDSGELTIFPDGMSTFVPSGVPAFVAS